MYFQQILDSFHQRRRRPHTPDFRIQRHRTGWRVFDGQTPIAFCWPTFMDIWSFSPFEEPQLAHVEEPGAVVDLHTVHNSVVNLAPHGWPRHWLADGRSPDDCVRWRWTASHGPRLEARITAAFAEAERIQWVFRVRYDPAWARYRYTFDIDAWKREPAGMEPLNMMLAGALEARGENRRWTHSIWESIDGRLRRVVHSNALFSCTDYADATWRTRHVPYRHAWVAYAAHRSFNPAMLLHANNVPMRLAICSQLFDEHIIWADAGEDNLDPDGFFHFHMQAEFVNLGAGLARRLLKAATDPIRPRRWRQEQVGLPFHMDAVNSFEKPVDPWQPEACPILVVPKAAGAAVQWTDEAAHSGRRSIRLSARAINERQELFPTGAVCNVRPHRRYRLSGWIRTRGVERFARLELAGYEYTYNNIIHNAASPPVSGDRSWTPAAVELDSADEAYLMPKLVLYGPGTAWFDDVQLTEASAG